VAVPTLAMLTLSQTYLKKLKMNNQPAAAMNNQPVATMNNQPVVTVAVLASQHKQGGQHHGTVDLAVALWQLLPHM